MAEKLQTELGDSLSKDDLVVGSTVIYHYRGKPYKGEILEVKCRLILFLLTSCSCNTIEWCKIVAGSEKTVVEESRSDADDQQGTSSKFAFYTYT